MAHGNGNYAINGIRDKNGDLDADAPNPVNVNPQFMGDYPQPK
ncbi:unnamed protein product, partial [Rotaria sordida]